MSIVKRIKPAFWDHFDAAHMPQRPLSFRSKWKLIVVVTSIVALAPLVIMTLIDFKLTRGAIESEVLVNTSRTVSNTWRSISFFLTQRRTALQFVARDNAYSSLMHQPRLESILKNLRSGIGGFEDIGIIDMQGLVKAYAGPYGMNGANVSQDKCFQHVVKNGFYISEVRPLSAASPRLVIAIRHFLPEGRFMVLRSALDGTFLQRILEQVEIGNEDDIFIVDDDGVLQTPSRFHGKLFERVSLPVPEPASGTNMKEVAGLDGRPVLMGFAHIPDTSLVLMLIKSKSEMMAMWYKPRMKLIGFLVASVVAVLAAILGSATYLVHRIHTAEKERVAAIHQVEYTNKLASLGRLASGVAHEINNPLAIINEKVGLINDLFTLRADYAADEKLMALIKGALSSVERAGSITRRLLNFARHMDTDIDFFDLAELIKDLLSFLEKEAAFRCIEIHLDIPEAKVEMQSDQGNLQQVLLNLINNAFAAMESGGRLDIVIKKQGADHLAIMIADNGHGIPQADLKHIFEPFFSTRSGPAGTGLGLSITYGLIQEIGGEIEVESKVGEGTRFMITLPRRVKAIRDRNACSMIDRDPG